MRPSSEIISKTVSSFRVFFKMNIVLFVLL